MKEKYRINMEKAQMTKLLKILFLVKLAIFHLNFYLIKTKY